jgi:acyl-CoA thioester hydrolase
MLPSIADFKHHVPVIIRFADMDAMGHVNNAKYQTYLEIGRTRYYSDLNLWDGQPGGIGPIMRKATLEYLLPLVLGDMIEVYTRCSRLGNKSYDIEHLIVRQTDGRAEIALYAVMTPVMFDHHNRCSVPLPDGWRHNIIAYETVPPQQEDYSR